MVDHILLSGDVKLLNISVSIEVKLLLKWVSTDCVRQERK